MNVIVFFVFFFFLKNHRADVTCDDSLKDHEDCLAGSWTEEQKVHSFLINRVSLKFVLIVHIEYGIWKLLKTPSVH